MLPKEVVPDSWVREILDYAPKGLSNKGGRTRKVLNDAIKAGFHMRDWFNRQQYNSTAINTTYTYVYDLKGKNTTSKNNYN
jgi:hypothetical protein